MANVSTQSMIEMVEGLLGTKDLNDREEDFITSVCNQYRSRTNKNKSVDFLSDKQRDWLERIWKRHFAG